MDKTQFEKAVEAVQKAKEKFAEGGGIDKEICLAEAVRLWIYLHPQGTIAPTGAGWTA